MEYTIYIRCESRDAGQPLAEAAGREQEEEGRGQRRAEEEARRVGARLLAPKPQQSHVSTLHASRAANGRARWPIDR